MDLVQESLGDYIKKYGKRIFMPAQNVFGLEEYIGCIGLLRLGETVEAAGRVTQALCLCKDGALAREMPFLSLAAHEVYRFNRNKNWLQSVFEGLVSEYEHCSRTPLSCGLNGFGGALVCPNDDSENLKHIAAVDLNSCLYRCERILGYFAGELNGSAAFWETRALERKKTVETLLWNPRKKMFMDYDCARDQFPLPVSCGGLMPYFVNLADITRSAGLIRLLSVLKKRCGCCNAKKMTACSAKYYFLASQACARYYYFELKQELETNFILAVKKNFRGSGISAVTAGVYLAFLNK